MSLAGQYNFRGINSQAWAAMVLFLQYVFDKDFDYILLEGEKLEDFTLFFKDNHKIICESKYRKDGLTKTELIKIATTVDKNKKLQEKDRLLIVTTNISKNTENFLKLIKFYPYDDPRFREERSKGLTKDQYKVLRHSDLWTVSDKFKEDSAIKLINELFGIWLPEDHLRSIVNDLLVEDIYKKSDKGATVSKDDFLDSIEGRKKTILKDSGYYIHRDRKYTEAQAIIKNIKNPTAVEFARNQLINLSSNRELQYFALIQLKEHSNLSLKEYDGLLSSTFGLLKFDSVEIIKSNLVKSNKVWEENIKYAITFLYQLVDKLGVYYSEKFYSKEILDVGITILNLSDDFDIDIFNLVKWFYEPQEFELFYQKKGSRDIAHWEREQIAELLKHLSEKADLELKKEIIEYLFNTFNFIEDDDEMWHRTPPQLYEVLSKYLDETTNDRDDFDKRLDNYVKEFVKQCEQFYGRYSKKDLYQGYDHVASGVSNSGGVFTLADKTFIKKILQPNIEKAFYDTKIIDWDFIKNSCVNEDVTKNKPDFTNRAVIPLLVQEYFNGTNSKEAETILKKFIKDKKEIPSKDDLIAQEILNKRIQLEKEGETLDEEKLAKITKYSLQRRGNLPSESFQEVLAGDLAFKGDTGFREILNGWTKNETYLKRTVFHSQINQILSKFINSSEEGNFKFGVKLFRNILNTAYFKNEYDRFEVFDLSNNLAVILEKDIEKGQEIFVNFLELANKEQSGRLTLNQQTILFSAIRKVDGKTIDEKDKDKEKKRKDIIKKVYDGLVKSILEAFPTNKKICKFIPDEQSRESLVQFGENLAKKGLIAEALTIVKMFINDPDPTLKNSDDDPDGTFNYDKKIRKGEDVSTINTVRGYCAWTLAHCTTLKGREYLEEVVGLTKKLAQDENMYIRTQSTFPLSELMRNRNTVLPQNRDERFMSKELAEEIEGIAISMLEDEENRTSYQVMKDVMRALSRMRSLTEAEAMEMFESILRLQETLESDNFSEVFEQILSTLLFYTIFRKDAFEDNDHNRRIFGKRFDNMLDFNDTPFREITNDLIKNGSPAIRTSLAWHFWKLTKDAKEEDHGKFFKISLDYLRKFVEEDSNYDHDVFERIYYFIDENIEKRFDDCFSLWEMCLAKEREYIRPKHHQAKGLDDMSWWPHYKNYEILIKIYEEKGSKIFLDWLEFLLGYPTEINSIHHLDIIIDKILLKLKSGEPHQETLNKIWEKIVERNVNFLEKKEEWEKNQS